MRLIVVVLGVLVLAACERSPSGEAPPIAPVDGRAAAQRIEADVRALADDRMEGREAGTRGYDLAAEYVAKRYAEVGLQPAGDAGSFFQQVPLLQATREREGAQLLIERGGRSIALRFKDQFLPALNYNAATHALTAPAVFVGQGVHAPELQHDDFAGIDLAGKIAVVFGGAPARFDNDRRAFYSSTREKLRALASRGGVGVIFVNTAEEEARSPWARSSDSWDKPGMRLRGADGKGVDTFPQLQAIAYVAAGAADLVFADGPQTAAQLFSAATAGTLQPFDLPGTLTLAGRTRIAPAQSRNVVARLPGAGKALAGEHIAYSAHLDHLGIGAPVKDKAGREDRIYNGALDNALGVAILLEAARDLATSKPRSQRSMLFVALTAEEKGLLGAEWFAMHPPVARGALVANINLDMPVLLAPSRDAIPIGIEHSTLQPAVAAAAKAVGVALSPDPFPEEVVFVRSDQYAFIRAGVPAIYLVGGVLAAQDEGADPKLALRDFLRNCYHQPCDDSSQPIQYADAVRLARLNAHIGRQVGNAKARPRWNPGDFFGDRFAPRAVEIPVEAPAKTQ